MGTTILFCIHYISCSLICILGENDFRLQVHVG